MVPQGIRVREVWSNDVRGIFLEGVKTLGLHLTSSREIPLTLLQVIKKWGSTGVKCFLRGVQAASLPSQLLVCSRCHSATLPSTLPRAERQLRWHWVLWWNSPVPPQPSRHSLVHALSGFLVALFFSTNMFGVLWKATGEEIPLFCPWRV